MLVRMMASGTLGRREMLAVLAWSMARGMVRGGGLLEVNRLPGEPVSHLRRYRVHATITLLGVPLFSKDNVGGACAMIEQSASGTSRISSIQFSSGSWPEKLKGFNRFGMAEEVVREEEGGVAESAYLSFMTSSAEKSLEQARQSFEEPFAARTSAQQISVAHGRARRSGYASALDHLTVPARSTWADRPRLAAEMRDRVSPLKEVANGSQASAYQPFLHTVRAAMTSDTPPAERIFTHNAKLYRLRTRTSPVPEGVLLIGKIAECGTNQESEFRIWFDPRDASGLPLRFEFRPKSFLHLVYEQDPGVSAPKFSTLIAQEPA
jgi:hypothetical protein